MRFHKPAVGCRLTSPRIRVRYTPRESRRILLERVLHGFNQSRNARGFLLHDVTIGPASPTCARARARSWIRSGTRKCSEKIPGARGYLLKDPVEEDLLKTIRSTHAGHFYFSPLIVRVLPEGYARGLSALAEGCGNKEIARHLSLHARRGDVIACASWRRWTCTAPPNSC